MEELRPGMRLTAGQMNKCYEVLKLHTLEQALTNGDAVAMNEMKKFRITVKRRLWLAHKGELKKIDDKKIRLQAIELLWKEVASVYRISYANAFAR